MFVGFGTVLNVAAILLGSIIGVVAGNKLRITTRNLMMDVLGAVTLISAAAAISDLWDKPLLDSTPAGAPLLIILGALLLGGLVGSVLDLENKLANFGFFLKERLDKDGESPFVEGFVTTSLLFVIGPLAILGSISDGMSSGIEQLTLKSILDFFAAIAFAAALGWGVAASALPVGVYQLAWTGVGFAVGEILTAAQISAMTATGGVLLFGIGLKLLNLKEIAIGNLLPALAFAPLITYFLN
jgi:uncharacterized membrane protein YqgA involved in biofilm formation